MRHVSHSPMLFEKTKKEGNSATIYFFASHTAEKERASTITRTTILLLGEKQRTATKKLKRSKTEKIEQVRAMMVDMVVGKRAKRGTTTRNMIMVVIEEKTILMQRHSIGSRLERSGEGEGHGD